MLRLATIFCICLTALPAFCQSSRWQVGTITEVRIHQSGERVGASDVVSYDVALKVGSTIYVVLYTPPLREETVKYAGGRELLVLVNKGAIRYNDMLGQSHDIPIESQRPASDPNGSRSASQRAP